MLRKYSTVLDFMLNLRTSLVSLEMDWADENLVVRRERRHPRSSLVQGSEPTNEKQIPYPQLHKVNIMRYLVIIFVTNIRYY